MDEKTKMKLKEMLRNCLSPADHAAISRQIDAMGNAGADDEPASFSGMPGSQETDTAKTYAMDSASERDPVKRVAGFLAAKARVEAVLGRPVLAHDSAGVFGEGIRALGGTPEGIHASGLPAVFGILIRGGRDDYDTYGRRLPPRIAPRDAKSFADRHPDAARIRVV